MTSLIHIHSPRTLAAAMLALFIFLVFGQTVDFAFLHWDDPYYVWDNYIVQGGLSRIGASWALTTQFFGLWHPLTWMSHMADVSLWGDWAGGHHLSSVAIHFGAAYFLFLFLFEATGDFWRSLAVSLLFAVHPSRAESVAWIAERKDVLCGLFWMLTLWAYARWRRCDQSNHWLLLTGIGCVLAMMSKPMAVTLPAVLLIVDRWPLAKSPIPRAAWIKLISDKWAFAILAALLVYITLVTPFAEASSSGFSMSLGDRVTLAAYSVIIYLWKAFFPVNLAFLHPLEGGHSPIGQVAIISLMLVPFLFYLAWRQRQRRPWLLFGLLWYLVTLLPVSGLVTIALYSHADRYMYLPLCGVFVAVVWSIPDNVNRRVLAASVLVLSIAILMLATWQVSHWKNTETMARRANAIYPGHHWVQLYVLIGLVEQGRYQEALDIGRKMNYMALGGANPLSQYELQMGNAEALRGNLSAAISHWMRAATINPAQWRAFHHLGRTLTELGKYEDAQRAFEGAFLTYDQAPELWIDYAKLAAAQGHEAEAIFRFRQAIDVSSFAREPETIMEFARYLHQVGKRDESLTQIETVLRISPSHREALELRAANLGTAQ